MFPLRGLKRCKGIGGFSLSLIIVVFFIAACRSLGSECLFEIDDFAFTTSVVDHQPVDRLNGFIRLRRGEPLFFWTNIRVHESGFRMLKGKEMLAIRHTWARDGLVVFKTERPGITSLQWKKSQERIETETAASSYGEFSWRTQSLARDDLTSGKWTVYVYDANGHGAFFRRQLLKASIQIELAD